ncbi:MAG: hypothetical protein CMJ25_03720 [Phycisphaerae bacterium]|nr:hypothetical protein [Phycisphaerae bacterium]
MAENNTPNGIGLSEAQNAISAMMAPQEDNATEVDAQAEETEVLEAEMLDEEEGEETPEAEASDLDGEDEADEDDDTSQDFDIMAAAVDVNGEEKTVEELKSGYLRQQDYTRKTQALSEEKKVFAEQRAAVDQERAQYAEALPMLAQQIQQSVEQEPDWDTLYDTDPALAAKAERQWRKQLEDKQKQLQAVQTEQQRMQQLHQQRMDQARAQFVDQQREVLPDLIPEWRDTKVAAQEAGEIREFLLQTGFPEQDIDGMNSALLVKMARLAMLQARGANRADKAKAKPKPAKGSKTMRAGSRGTQPKPKNAVREAQQRLKSTGRVNDAAAAIKALL